MFSTLRWSTLMLFVLFTAGCGAEPGVAISESSAALSGPPAPGPAAPPPGPTEVPVVLDYKSFSASGAGALTTKGSIPAGSAHLGIAWGASWKTGHWARVRRAGASKVITNVAPSCATLDPCIVAPMDGDTAYDELRVRIKPSAAIAAGDLQVELSGPVAGGVRRSKVQMPLPAMQAAWSDTHLRLQARKGPRRHEEDFLVDRVDLRCMKNCAGLTANVSQLELVQDLVAKIEEITPGPQLGSATLRLDRVAPRGVRGETVFHDDSRAVQDWLDHEPARPHVAPAGVYYLSKVPVGSALLIGSKTRIEGAGADLTIFKNAGGASTGLPTLFLSCAATVCGTARYCANDPGCNAAPERIHITGCGFDMNGLNFADFTDVLGIAGNYVSMTPARDIRIANNRFFDSVYDANPSLATEDCDLYLDQCATRQRQHVSVTNARDVLIEDNDLSGGGRIKAGGPGTNITIRRNHVNFVNDNAITVVQSASPSAPCVPVGVEAPPATGIPCLSHQIVIRDNVIANAVGASIFYGADGQTSDNTGMRIENVTIENNEISGYFSAGIHGVIPGGGANWITIAHNGVHSVRPRPIMAGRYTTGISLIRGDSGSTLAGEGIVVLDNTITTAAPFGAYTLSGLYAVGPMAGARIDGNHVECANCSASQVVDTGMFFAGPASTRTEVVNNTVKFAQVAVRVDSPMSSMLFRGNYLNRTRVGAHLALQPPAGTTLSARIEDNQFIVGADAGVRCVPTGATFALTFANNVFNLNTGGDVVGCP